MKKLVFRYGNLANIILIITGTLPWLIAGFSMPYRIAELVGYVSMLLALSMVYFGMRKYRDQENNGQLQFKQGLKVGLLITLFPSVIIAICTIILILFLGDEFMNYALEYYKTTVSAAEYAEIEAQVNNPIMQNPLFQGLVMFVTVFLLGFIVSLVSAFMLRTSKNPATS